ncbi:MAG: magnesium transporter [Planctomycetota bacterium]|jgi:magnesium transporter
MAHPNPLVPLVRKYIETDAAGAARILEKMDEETAAAALRQMPAAVIAHAFPHLQAAYSATLLKSASPEVFRAVAKELDPQRAAKIFMRLPTDARERFVPHLPEKLKHRVQELLTYPVDSVGAIMTTSFLAFRPQDTVKEAVQKLRSLAKKRVVHSYAYVTDDHDRLLGVLNMYELMLASPGQPLESVMKTDVFTIDSFMDRATAADELSKRRYFAAPVADSENHLLGVIRAEQLIGDVKEEAAEDIQKMFGVSAEERAFSPLRFSLMRRLPWLHVNLATAFLAAGVVAMFEDIIAKMTALAILLPVVAGQVGNAGAQSLAIVMRGLVMREIPKQKIRRLILKEAWLGTITGAVTGVVTGLLAWLWQGNPALGVVIGLGMLVNLFAAGLAGASIPLLMKSLGWDPAQCSSIILTTVTDVIGFLAFLGFAVAFQGWLL